MPTPAINHEEIVAHDLRAVLFDMHGISRASVMAHYRLY